MKTNSNRSARHFQIDSRSADHRVMNSVYTGHLRSQTEGESRSSAVEAALYVFLHIHITRHSMNTICLPTGLQCTLNDAIKLAHTPAVALVRLVKAVDTSIAHPTCQYALPTG